MAEPTPSFIATEPCGCCVGWVNGGDASVAELFIATWKSHGMNVREGSHDESRGILSRCGECRGAKGGRMKYDSTAYRIARYFANYPGLHNAVTIGDLQIAIDARPGTAVYQRLKCDLMPKFSINKTKKEHTYWVTSEVAEQLKSLVSSVYNQHVQVMRDRELGTRSAA